MRVKITFDHGLTYIRDSDTGKILCSILAFELSMDSRRPGESTVKVMWHYTDAHIEQIAKRVADHFTHDIKKSGVNR